MDFSALLSGLITENTVKEVSKKSGASKKDVSSVLTTALPMLLTSGNNTTAAQVSQQSGVSQNTTSNVLSAAAPLLLGSLGQGNGQQAQAGTSAAANIAVIGALLGKLDLGKLTSGLMGLVSTNTASSGKEEKEEKPASSGKKKPAAKTDGKKTDGKKTDSKKKTSSTTGKKKTSSTTSSKKKPGHIFNTFPIKPKPQRRNPQVLSMPLPVFSETF